MNATAATILLHYYTTEEDYKDPNLMSPTEKEAIRLLIGWSLIDSTHTITPRGVCLVKYWLEAQLPEQVWVMVPSV